MKIGANDIAAVKIGSVDVNKVYLGNNLVWEKAALLLDLYPNAAAAYSLRKLRTAYTGDVIRVRIDTTGQPEYNIGFVNGVLDVATLESYCVGGLNAYVKTWYDQSSGGLDAEQTTALNQPQIVSSGSVILENGKPTINFDGVSQSLAAFLGLMPQPTTDLIVYSFKSGSGLGAIIDSNSGTGRHFIESFTTGFMGLFSGNHSISTTARDTNQNLITALFDGTSNNSKLFQNSVDLLIDGNTGTNSLDSIAFARNQPSTAFSNINIQEYIIYSNNQSTNRTSIEANINDHYTIY